MTPLLVLFLGHFLQAEPGDLRWPLGPGNKAYALRATYGQLEGTMASYWSPHLGLDVLGKPMQTVYAIEEGTVVGTRYEGELSAVLVESKAVDGRAFLYLHLDPCSIDVAVGEEVKVGKRLGRIAKTNSGTGEPHLHLARLGGKYESHDWWDLSETSVANPLTLLQKGKKGDDQKPTLVAFANSLRVALKDDDDGGPGLKDVVVHAYDTDLLSTHLLAPRELRLTILSNPSRAVEAAFLPITFDGALSKDGLEGLYDFSPEFPSKGDTATKLYDYFFVLTNTGQDGSGVRGWKPVPGDYLFRVEVQDAGGNEHVVEEPIHFP